MAPTIAIPDTAEGMQEFLLDKTKRDQIFKGDASPEDITGFMSKYANLHAKRAPDVTEQVTEQVNTAFANFARENGIKEFRKEGRTLSAEEARKERVNNRASTVKWSKGASGTPLDGQFSSLMEFMSSLDRKALRTPEQEQRLAKVKNALSSVDPGSGGFLVPEEFRSELMQIALETAVVRPRARVIPMSSLRTSIPFVDSTSNTASVYGGVVAYWTEEGAPLVDSQPAFGRVTLEAKKLTAYTEVPSELTQDSAVSVDGMLGDMFPEAIAWFEDIAFMKGTGVGEPLGVFNPLNSALIAQVIEAGQGAGTILWENLIKMYSRMLPSSLSSAVWVVSPNTFPELATMALSVGTGGSAVWLNNGVEGPPMSILGRPVIVSEKVASLGGVGDVNFVDFRQYLLGDRMAMSADTSTEYKFGQDLVAYRFIERVDGRPWLQSAITPQNGGPTLSPYIQLAARP